MKQLYERPEISVDEFVVDNVILDGSGIPEDLLNNENNSIDMGYYITITIS